MPSPRHSRIPVTLLTGFLGSGKTSLLRRLLGDARMARTAVIINELGEVGLDHLLVGRVSPDILLLESGCLCCTVRSDFADALKDLAARVRAGEIPSFDRVIVETTGIADPVPLLRLLLTDDSLASRYRVHGVVTTLDASLAPDARLNARPERSRQIGVADALILTKTDLADPVVLAAVEDEAARLNGEASVIEGGDLGAVIDLLLGTCDQPIVRELVSARADERANVGVRPEAAGTMAHGRVNSVILLADAPLRWESVALFLRDCARRFASQLLRIKGIVHVAESERPLVIHGVQHFLYPEVVLEDWDGSDRQTRIVIIGEGLPAAEISGMFLERCGAAAD